MTEVMIPAAAQTGGTGSPGSTTTPPPLPHELQLLQPATVAHSVELVSQFARPWRWMVCSGT
jgi:hypothetical protein